MELIIHGWYIEYHLQSFSAEQHQRIVEYCREKFSELGYATEDDAMNSILIDAWLQSTHEGAENQDFHFFVHPTEGDYSLPAASFRRIELCRVFGVDMLMPDFVISGHIWPVGKIGAISVDLFMLNNGKTRHLRRKGLRLSKRKHAIALTEDAMTFFYCRCWNSVQVSYLLPCKESTFRKTNIDIEIVKVGSPVESDGIVQRISYGGKSLSFTDYRCWTGWNVYTGWWPVTHGR